MFVIVTVNATRKLDVFKSSGFEHGTVTRKKKKEFPVIAPARFSHSPTH